MRLFRMMISLALTLALLCTLVPGAQAETAVLPTALKTIEAGAFENDVSLTNVVIPQGTTAIGARAFAGCSNLEDVTIPESVTSIASDAFEGCPEGMVVSCAYDSEAFYWVLEQEDFYVATGREMGSLNIYVRQEWLDALGLETPETIGELIETIEIVAENDPNGNGLRDEVGLTAFYEDYFFMVLNRLDSSFTEEQMEALMVSGYYQASTRPFDANAFAIVNDMLPERVASEYTLLTFPAATATPTPAPGLRQLAAPTNLEWGTYYCWDELIMDDYPGMISWYTPDENMDIDHKYEVVIYRVTAEGTEKIQSALFGKWAGGYQYSTHPDFVNNGIAESGDYYFTVQALGDNTTCTSSPIVTSDVWSYTLPSKVLDAPDELVWDGTTARWNASDDEDAGGYTVWVYYSATDANATDVDELERVYGFVWYFAEGSTEPALDFGEEVFTKAGYYYFKVKTVSANVELACHSPKSKLSAAKAYGMGTETTPAPEATEDATATPTATPTPTPAPTDAGEEETQEKYAYINKTWLDVTGCVMPTDADELIELMKNVSSLDPNGNGKSDEIGIAAESMYDYVIALQAVQSDFEIEKLYLLLAAGEFYFAESEKPFEENALVVVWTSLPAEYADDYVMLSEAEVTPTRTATSAPTATPTPTPTDAGEEETQEKYAYINKTWLDVTGCEMPTDADELIWLMKNVSSWDPNGNGKSDEIGIAAESMDDYAIALQAVQPDFEMTKFNMVVAAGEICIAESETPFEENALVVVWTSLPAAYVDEYIAL